MTDFRSDYGKKKSWSNIIGSGLGFAGINWCPCRNI